MISIVVLLFSCVQELVIHRVDFAEVARVVRLPFTLLQEGEHSLKLMQDRLVLCLLRHGCGQDRLSGFWEHKQVLQTGGHVTGCSQIDEADVTTLLTGVVARIQLVE